MAGDLQGMCGIVTGAGSGIGLAASRLLASRGMRLALVGRREGPLTEAIATLDGDGHVAIAGNIGDLGFAVSLAKRAGEALGGLDAIINNAGYAPLEPLGSGERETIEACFLVNAIGPAVLIESAIGLLREGSAARHAGVSSCVVNVSTLGTADPFPGFFAYAASKAAVNSMTRSIANECDAPTMRSFTVAPGAVETGMLRGLFDESMVPAEMALDPEDVGALIAACVAGERDGDAGRTLFIAREADGPRVWAAPEGAA